MYTYSSSWCLILSEVWLCRRLHIRTHIFCTLAYSKTHSSPQKSRNCSSSTIPNIIFCISITPAGEKFVYRRREGWSSQEVRCLRMDKILTLKLLFGDPFYEGVNSTGLGPVEWKNIIFTSVATAIVRLTLAMIPIEVSEVAWQPETLVKGSPTSLIEIGFRRARKLGHFLFTTIGSCFLIMFAIVLIPGIGISEDRVFNQKGVLPTREDLASLFRRRCAATKTQQPPSENGWTGNIGIILRYTNHHDQFSNPQFPKSWLRISHWNLEPSTTFTTAEWHKYWFHWAILKHILHDWHLQP